MAQYSVFKTQNFANVSTDRIIEVKVKDGAQPKSSTGLLDSRLFTGDNHLHAIQDAGLWYLKYEKGGLPSPLKQKFTNFNQLLKHVKTYFEGRNAEVKEIVA